jgi:YVTN family beta-propeller protein
VSVTGANEVAVIDMANLAVVSRIQTGAAPMGLILLDPAARTATLDPTARVARGLR